MRGSTVFLKSIARQDRDRSSAYIGTDKKLIEEEKKNTTMTNHDLCSVEEAGTGTVIRSIWSFLDGNRCLGIL